MTCVVGARLEYTETEQSVSRKLFAILKKLDKKILKSILYCIHLYTVIGGHLGFDYKPTCTSITYVDGWINKFCYDD